MPDTDDPQGGDRPLHGIHVGRHNNLQSPESRSLILFLRSESAQTRDQTVRRPGTRQTPISAGAPRGTRHRGRAPVRGGTSAAIAAQTAQKSMVYFGLPWSTRVSGDRPPANPPHPGPSGVTPDPRCCDRCPPLGRGRPAAIRCQEPEIGPFGGSRDALRASPGTGPETDTPRPTAYFRVGADDSMPEATMSGWCAIALVAEAFGATGDESRGSVRVNGNPRGSKGSVKERHRPGLIRPHGGNNVGKAYLTCPRLLPDGPSRGRVTVREPSGQPQGRWCRPGRRAAPASLGLRLRLGRRQRGAPARVLRPNAAGSAARTA
jgi:hypothetical protein